MQSACISCPILVTLEFSRQIFDKYSNFKFIKNPLSGIRVVACWQTDRRTDGGTERYDKANIRFSRFCESS